MENAKKNSQEGPTALRYKMVSYKCFQCGKQVKQDYIKKKIRCPYCGYKILFKERTVTAKVKAE